MNPIVAGLGLALGGGLGGLFSSLFGGGGGGRSQPPQFVRFGGFSQSPTGPVSSLASGGPASTSFTGVTPSLGVQTGLNVRPELASDILSTMPTGGPSQQAPQQSGVNWGQFGTQIAGAALSSVLTPLFASLFQRNQPQARPTFIPFGRR